MTFPTPDPTFLCCYDVQLSNLILSLSDLFPSMDPPKINFNLAHGQDNVLFLFSPQPFIQVIVLGSLLGFIVSPGLSHPSFFANIFPIMSENTESCNP